jgi:uncharacterized protein YwqG
MGFFDIFKKKKDDLTSELESYKTEQPQVSQQPPISDERNQKLCADEAFRLVKKETEIPCVTMELSQPKPSIFESKIGGVGYIPHDGDFPEDSRGNQLRLLAQINCADISLDDFPKHGLLQFWILNNDVFGLNFDDGTKQDTFRVIYHKDIDKSVTEEEILSKIKDNEFEADGEGYMPVEGEYGLTFKADTDYMSDNDCHFDKLFCEKYNRLNPPEPIDSLYDFDIDLDELELYDESMDKSFNHKIGGYPGFTQWDPRNENDDKYNFLLFQLDSDFKDNHYEILWGDAGIGNFFINREKLKQLDFSDVLYNWDCY